MDKKSKYEYVDIDSLIPYANNARTHSTEQIKLIQSSLREFGFINPVIIDKENGIIAGHGRVLAAKREGITEIPCIRVEHLTEAQKRAYILADNRLAELSEWDEELLKIEIEQLDGLDFDLDMLGFDLSDFVFDEHRSVIDNSKKPKSEKQIIKWLKKPHSDSAEYKMWGNGVALPCVYFVLSGIRYYDERGVNNM